MNAAFTPLATFCTVLASYVYVLLEWYFFATRPSLMSDAGLGGHLSVLLIDPLPIAAVATALEALIIFLSRPLPAAWGRRAKLLVPAVLLACGLFLAADTFTYTVFSFGMPTVKSMWRLVYGGVFVVMVVLLVRELETPLRYAGKSVESALRAVALGLVALSVAALLAKFAFVRGTGFDVIDRPGQRPDIILISGDALTADSMSVYGYKHDTTPVLRELAKDSVLFENAFPNLNRTNLSLTSVMTGRGGGQLRFASSDKVLNGEAAYRHLPGLLRKMGYATIQSGQPIWVDAFYWNMRDGFDVVNGSRMGLTGAMARVRDAGGPRFDRETQFLFLTASRVREHLRHAFGGRRIEDLYEKFKFGRGGVRGDGQRVKDLTRFLSKSKKPVFAEMHLLESHGHRNFFVEGKSDAWKQDAYEHGIASDDENIGRVIGRLKKLGRYDNALIVIFSDHGNYYSTEKRQPLLIKLPGRRTAERRKENAQNLDIAPTVLDVLGVSKPAWMDGASLLRPTDPNRPLFVLNIAEEKHLDMTKKWGQIRSAALICRNYYYELPSGQTSVLVRPIAGHTDPVATPPLAPDAARGMLEDYLRNADARHGKAQ